MTMDYIIKKNNFLKYIESINEEIEGTSSSNFRAKKLKIVAEE